jgi:hypothetical protein
LRCPVWGEATGVPILWGYPTPEDVEKVEAGEWDVVLGGCVIPDPFVDVACRACGARWHHEDSLGLGEDP